MEDGAFLDPKNWYSRGYLPHFDSPGRTQFITFRLADACPKELHARWKSELLLLPPDKQKSEYASKLMKYLDRGAGECLLKNESIARMMEEALLNFDGQRYRMLSWVVMPNHVHLLAELMEGFGLDKIVQGWKSYSAHRINKMLGRTGTVWHREYYDRFIRDSNHYEDVVSYFHANPVRARLCAVASDWRWSSAYRNRAVF